VVETIIEMNNIVKVFPPSLVALDNVSVDFRKGEIHAIVGENGAGKSTLMKILYGLEERSAGEIIHRGKPIHFRQPGDAIASGIGMVHQEILLIPEYSVWENVVLGVEPRNFFGRLDVAKAQQQVAQKIYEFQFNLDPVARVEDISVAARQKVEILKLLFRNVSVLILDEPTAVLTPQEIPQLFSELRRLKDNGHTILFISHHLDEVVELSDRTSVLRKGQKIATVDTASTSKRELAQMMVGREVIFSSIAEKGQPGEVILSVDHLIHEFPNGRQSLRDIHFQVRAGDHAINQTNEDLHALRSFALRRAAVRSMKMSRYSRPATMINTIAACSTWINSLGTSVINSIPSAPVCRVAKNKPYKTVAISPLFATIAIITPSQA